MDDLISRQAAIDALYEGMPGLTLGEVLKRLRELPTIDPVRHGRWMKKRHEVWDGEYIWSYRCSECSSPGDGTAFCPYCGAKMEGESDGK